VSGNPTQKHLNNNHDFIRLWTSGASSGLGTSMAALVYPLLALSVADTAGQAGLLGLVALAAGTLMRLPAGALVDQLPLRRVLVGAHLLRSAASAVLLAIVMTGHLMLWQLLTVAGVNGTAAAFAEIAHSVAVRHVVAPEQLPAAFALDEGRGHAISLAGQPAGGLLYGIAASLPLAADLVCSLTSAVISAAIKAPMRPSTDHTSRPRLRAELLTGLAFLWREPFLRATLFAASGYQLVYTGTVFVLIANFTASNATSADLGVLFAIGAIGGILGALAAPHLQPRLQLRTQVIIMGWTAAAVFASLAWVDQPLVAGALLGCIFFTSAPANAMLLSAQVARAPTHLQGRVIAASYLIAGLVAPLGPPLSGLLLDTTGPVHLRHDRHHHRRDHHRSPPHPVDAEPSPGPGVNPGHRPAQRSPCGTPIRPSCRSADGAGAHAQSADDVLKWVGARERPLRNPLLPRGPHALSEPQRGRRR